VVTYNSLLKSLNRCLRFTGPPNGPVLFCTLTSVVVCRLDGRRAGGRARGWSGDRHCTAGQYGYVPLRRHLVSTWSNCLRHYLSI